MCPDGGAPLAEPDAEDRRPPEAGQRFSGLLPHLPAGMDTYTKICIHRTYTFIYIEIHMHSYASVSIHTYIFIYIIYIHRNTYTFIYIYIYTEIHIHSYASIYT